jgi:hypothetical protein
MVLKPLAFLSLIRMPASLTSLKGSRSRICFQTSPFVKKVFQKGFTLQHSNFLSYFDPIGLNHLSFILAHRIVKFCNPSALQSLIQIPICRWCESIPKVWRMGWGSRWWCLLWCWRWECYRHHGRSSHWTSSASTLRTCCTSSTASAFTTFVARPPWRVSGPSDGIDQAREVRGRIPNGSP